MVKLGLGQIHYTAFLYENGTFVDDLLCHKVAEDEFLLVVNASNTDKDFAWAASHAGGFDCSVVNESDRTGQVALQGRNSIDVLQPLVDIDLGAMKYYWFGPGKFLGVPVLIARTGYTGEDGFEVYCEAGKTPMVWEALMDSGVPFGLVPTGLGCRNTLRLEAKMALYGHEIDDTTHALEAGLGWIVKLDKGDFVGRAALARQKEQGIQRKLIGFEMCGRGIGRDGYEVLVDGAPAGWVTSGSPAPALNKNIGLCYLPVAQTQIGRAIEIVIRSQPVAAVTVETPFYKRAR